jgi:DNA-binding response OmpR family regulator
MQSKIETDADPPTDILVVEDDVLLIMALAGELRSAGFNVIEARDGEEALTILLTANNIGLVVADADWLRQTGPHVNVMLVSRYETRRGSAAFAKPFNLQVLVRSAKELLRGTPPKS